MLSRKLGEHHKRNVFFDFSACNRLILLKVVVLFMWYKKYQDKIWIVNSYTGRASFCLESAAIIVGRSTIVLTGRGEDPAGVVRMDIPALSRTCVLTTSWLLCYLWSNVWTAQFLKLYSIRIQTYMENICVQNIINLWTSKLFSDRCSNRPWKCSISEVYKNSS
jgi:hypothetical protein